MAAKATRIGSRKTPPSRPAQVTAMKDHDFQAEEDARTIARARAIQSDPDRMRGAAKAAARIVEEKAAELRGFRSIARRAR